MIANAPYKDRSHHNALLSIYQTLMKKCAMSEMVVASI